jgi:large subunit ribosomal protein L22
MSRALIKNIRVSPLKARMVAKAVQGMNAELAMASLEFMPNKAAAIISKAIASAVANGGYEPQEVEVTSCRVDKAAYLKRFRPRARGTASRILKPTSHILVEVGTAVVAPAKVAKAPKAAPKKEVATEAPAKKAPVAKKAPAKKAAPKKEAENSVDGKDA